MSQKLFPLVLSQCEEGVPSPELVEQWLNSKPDLGGPADV